MLINYADPSTPGAVYAIASLEQVANKSAWTRRTKPNPQIDNFLLGDAEEISWKSTGGKVASGLLVKPVGYEKGKRYPLIVSIHGGPASADVLGFNGGYGSQIYARAGYAVLLPNYRNSTNYGEKFKIESQGDYCSRGYQDITTAQGKETQPRWRIAALPDPRPGWRVGVDVPGPGEGARHRGSRHSAAASLAESAIPPFAIVIENFF